MAIAADAEMESAPDEPGDQPRHLVPAAGDTITPKTRATDEGGSGSGSGDASMVVDALKASADQELTIAERLSSKARQAFALAAGIFVVAQTVAFNSFETSNLSTLEKHWMVGLAIGAVAILGLAAFFTVKADATVDSRDLPLEKLEADLNAAYEGDGDVPGRLGGYYLGVVRTRREANSTRRDWYRRDRLVVILAVTVTVAELIVSLAARANG